MDAPKPATAQTPDARRRPEEGARWVPACLSAAAVALALACHQGLFTAPPASSITLLANPSFIPAHGGTALITAYLTEPNGTPVSDGTVVQFITDLGRIDPQARTDDGVARAYLRADGRSGTATVVAVSGGPAAPGGSGGPAPSPGDGKAMSTGTSSTSVQVRIGTILPARMIVTAVPSRLQEQRASRITANVFDGDGNPVANVPVIFAVLSDSAEESMDSQGTPTFTDNNGQAIDIMRTRRERDAPQAVVRVQAITPNLKDPTTVLVTLN